MDDFTLKLSNYTSFKRFFLHNTTFSVQLPYFAGHSLKYEKYDGKKWIKLVRRMIGECNNNIQLGLVTF